MVTPFQKIASIPLSCASVPIRLGDRFWWHYACFSDLKSERSCILSTSYAMGIQSGIAGQPSKVTDVQCSGWLTEAHIATTCYLGEKSYWKKNFGGPDIIFLVEVIRVNDLDCNQYPGVEYHYSSFHDMSQQEILMLYGFDNHYEKEEAEEEAKNLATMLFTDKWLDESTYYWDCQCLDIELLQRRRMVTKGGAAIALRRLGAALRRGEEETQRIKAEKREAEKEAEKKAAKEKRLRRCGRKLTDVEHLTEALKQAEKMMEEDCG